MVFGCECPQTSLHFIFHRGKSCLCVSDKNLVHKNTGWRRGSLGAQKPLVPSSWIASAAIQTSNGPKVADSEVRGDVSTDRRDWRDGSKSFKIMDYLDNQPLPKMTHLSLENKRLFHFITYSSSISSSHLPAVNAWLPLCALGEDKATRPLCVVTHSPLCHCPRIGLSDFVCLEWT